MTVPVGWVVDARSSIHKSRRLPPYEQDRLISTRLTDLHHVNPYCHFTYVYLFACCSQRHRKMAHWCRLACKWLVPRLRDFRYGVAVPTLHPYTQAIPYLYRCAVGTLMQFVENSRAWAVQKIPWILVKPETSHAPCDDKQQLRTSREGTGAIGRAERPTRTWRRLPTVSQPVRHWSKVAYFHHMP